MIKKPLEWKETKKGLWYDRVSPLTEGSRKPFPSPFASSPEVSRARSHGFTKKIQRAVRSGVQHCEVWCRGGTAFQIHDVKLWHSSADWALRSYSICSESLFYRNVSRRLTQVHSQTVNLMLLLDLNVPLKQPETSQKRSSTSRGTSDLHISSVSVISFNLICESGRSHRSSSQRDIMEFILTTCQDGRDPIKWHELSLSTPKSCQRPSCETRFHPAPLPRRPLWLVAAVLLYQTDFSCLNVN